MPDGTAEVIVGVDTHADTHTAVAIDHLGRHRDSVVIQANAGGVLPAARVGAQRR